VLYGQGNHRFLGHLDLPDLHAGGREPIPEGPTEERSQIRDVLVQRALPDLLTAFENERIQIRLRDLSGGMDADYPFKMLPRQQNLVDRGVFPTFHLLESAVLPGHLIPGEVHNAGEHIRIQLGVLDVPEMLGQALGGERLGPAPTTLVPAHPVAPDVLSLVDPWLFHGLHHIGSEHTVTLSPSSRPKLEIS
jgi:hypothetical protein